MRKIVLALAAASALGLAMPLVSTPAEAAKKVVIVKKKKVKHWNRGHHYGWYKKKKSPRATVIVR